MNIFPYSCSNTTSLFNVCLNIHYIDNHILFYQFPITKVLINSNICLVQNNAVVIMFTYFMVTIRKKIPECGVAGANNIFLENVFDINCQVYFKESRNIIPFYSAVAAAVRGLLISSCTCYYWNLWLF